MMNPNSNKGIGNFYGLANLYPATADLYNTSPYPAAPPLRSDLLNTEFDSYSDVSIDTSSVLSLDSSFGSYKVKENESGYIHPHLKSVRGLNYMKCGSTGKEEGRSISPFDLTKSSVSSRFSDDEMDEFFPFDHRIVRRRNMLKEQEELRYLAELVQRDIAAAELYGEYHSRTPRDAFWRMQQTEQTNADFYSDLLLLHQLREEKFLKKKERELQQNEISKWKLRHVLTNQSGGMRNQKQVHPQRKYIGKHNDARGFGRTKHEKHTLREALVAPEPIAKHASHASQKLVEEVKEQVKPTPSDPSSSDSNADQRVFLGGLPIGMTERTLRQQLAQQGYKVLKRPKILRGFAPEVLMRSVEEAKDLVEKGVVMIDGIEVEVRPFNSLMKQSESKKIPNIGKRSVFLGGLAPGTTAKDIQNVMSIMGMKIVNYPVIKFGFSRQVIFETISQAQTLINMKKVMINGTYVDVRPFVNHQSRKRSH